jgi:hypothetical protein
MRSAARSSSATHVASRPQPNAGAAPCDRAARLTGPTRRRRGAWTAATVLVGALVSAATLTGCGSDDGPRSFLARDAESALFVEWKRVGDDVSGSVSAAEINRPQSGLFQTAAQPPGEVTEQTSAFTGTVSDDSVRLTIGSGAASNRINGRLDGDTLELTIPSDGGAETLRLKPAGQDEYKNAVQHIRDGEQRRKDDAKAALARKQRTDRKTITRVATAFQKALAPSSPDDPCRYLTPELRDDIVSFANATAPDPDVADIPCRQGIRDSEGEREKPLYTGPQGVASIRFLSSLISPRGIGQAGPPGAVVTWRPASGRGNLSQSETSFTEQNGRWLVYRCCQ